MTLADVRFAWFRWSPGLLLSVKIALRVLGEALEFQVRLLGEA
jgi:hypothetical protein